ncbi:MAG: hypothetical protein F7C33_07235 [Desulfurococcales archaeon]|nr:hypothetical protein [Desulfurococcales archaeon]
MQNTSTREIKKVIEEKIELIKVFLESTGASPLWVPVSGGKDSVAVWALANGATRDYATVFIHIPGQSHADNITTVYGVADRLGVKDRAVVRVSKTRLIRDKLSQALESCGRPCLLHVIAYTHRGEDYWAAMKRYGFPAPLGRFGKGTRWCCGVFKHRVLQRLPYNGERMGVPWKYGVNGVKATDSPYRARKYRSDVQTWEKTRDTYLFPLRTLRDPQVWGILEYYGLAGIVRLQYDKWGRSPNCMFCPMLGKTRINRTAPAIPESVREKIAGTLWELLPRYKPGTYSRRMIQLWLEALGKQVAQERPGEALAED